MQSGIIDFCCCLLLLLQFEFLSLLSPTLHLLLYSPLPSCDNPSVKVINPFVKHGLLESILFLFVLYFKLWVTWAGNLGACCFCSLEMAHRK